jgi:hypothetical protein
VMKQQEKGRPACGGAKAPPSAAQEYEQTFVRLTPQDGGHRGDARAAEDVTARTQTIAAAIRSITTSLASL